MIEVRRLGSQIGAAMNRLTITIANLATAAESLSAANSRIRDVDVAQETAELTRNHRSLADAQPFVFGADSPGHSKSSRTQM